MGVLLVSAHPWGLHIAVVMHMHAPNAWTLRGYDCFLVFAARCGRGTSLCCVCPICVIAVHDVGTWTLR